MSYAEKNLELARVNFQTAVKEIYVIADEKNIKPAMEHKEYDVGEKPEKDRIQVIILLYELDKRQPL